VPCVRNPEHTQHKRNTHYEHVHINSNTLRAHDTQRTHERHNSPSPDPPDATGSAEPATHDAHLLADRRLLATSNPAQRAHLVVDLTGARAWAAEFGLQTDSLFGTPEVASALLRTKRNSGTPLPPPHGAPAAPRSGGKGLVRA
jgi:hypothetical protein